MSTKRSSKSKSKSQAQPEPPDKAALMETQQSLETLVKLAGNPDCIASLLEGLTSCLHSILSVSEQEESDVLDHLLTALLNQIVQTCADELEACHSSSCPQGEPSTHQSELGESHVATEGSTGYTKPDNFDTRIIEGCGQKLAAFHHMTKLLRLCMDILQAKQRGMLYSTLCVINRIMDICFMHEAHHIWRYTDNGSLCNAHSHIHSGAGPPAGSGPGPGPSHGSGFQDSERPGSLRSCKGQHLHPEQKQDNSEHNISSTLSHSKSDNIGSLETRASPKIERSSKKLSQLRKLRFVSQPESNWSLRSIFNNFADGPSLSGRENSSVEPEPESSSSINMGTSFRGVDKSPAITVTSPLDVLMGSDPTAVLNVLQESIIKHKQMMGTRHKCTPSVRQQSCTFHCLQILSARVLTLMCQSHSVQQQLVSQGHIKVFVDALDPNHDPHLLCLVLQSLALIAMIPTHHTTLTEADVPDTLMQLLLPSDEWYYTNHSTKYARYVKYHAARILVYMGLFHRLGGRVDLFEFKAFEPSSNTNMLGLHQEEDLFIDQMALGTLIVKDSGGTIRAGSLEGLILEVIEDWEKELRNQAPFGQDAYSMHFPHSETLPNSASGYYSQPDDHLITTDTSSDLANSPFREYFFHAVPLIVHPIIILRLLCHKMFGNMLRKKTSYSAHNLSPPLVLETDVCPPRPTSMVESGTTAKEQTPSCSLATKRRRQNLHVQISTPGHEEDSDEEIRLTRRRTHRAGSMDKHLLRLSTARKRAANATMTYALMAIGDSLMQPLDLNISSQPQDLDDDVWTKKKYSFKLPSLKKRSHSQGYIMGIEDSLESFSSSPKSSAMSVVDNEDAIKELEKELINLPTFEIDTHRLDQTASPLLSRSSSVPDLDHSSHKEYHQTIGPSIKHSSGAAQNKLSSHITLGSSPSKEIQHCYRNDSGKTSGSVDALKLHRVVHTTNKDSDQSQSPEDDSTSGALVTSRRNSSPVSTGHVVYRSRRSPARESSYDRSSMEEYGTSGLWPDSSSSSGCDMDSDTDNSGNGKSQNQWSSGNHHPALPNNVSDNEVGLNHKASSRVSGLVVKSSSLAGVTTDTKTVSKNPMAKEVVVYSTGNGKDTKCMLLGDGNSYMSNLNPLEDKYKFMPFIDEESPTCQSQNNLCVSSNKRSSHAVLVRQKQSFDEGKPPENGYSGNFHPGNDTPGNQIKLMPISSQEGKNQDILDKCKPSHFESSFQDTSAKKDNLFMSENHNEDYLDNALAKKRANMRKNQTSESEGDTKLLDLMDESSNNCAGLSHGINGSPDESCLNISSSVPEQSLQDKYLDTSPRSELVTSTSHDNNVLSNSHIRSSHANNISLDRMSNPDDTEMYSDQEFPSVMNSGHLKDSDGSIGTPQCAISVTSAVLDADHLHDDSADSPMSGSMAWGYMPTSSSFQSHLLSPLTCSPSSSKSTPTQDMDQNAIIFKFAAATPCESPSSSEQPDQLTPPPLPPVTSAPLPSRKGRLSLPNTSTILQNSGSAAVPCTVLQARDQLVHFYKTPPPPSQPPSPHPDQLYTPNPISCTPSLSSSTLSPSVQALSTVGRPMDFLSVGIADNSSYNSSHNSLLMSPCSHTSSSAPRSPNFSLLVPSPGVEVPLQHKGIMMVMETWVSVCSLDLECDQNMRKEVKDFLNKMSSLGAEYRSWSLRMRARLRLEENTEKTESSEAGEAAENIHIQYKKCQQLILSGDLPCSKEEAATLAGIQLHLEDTWPDDITMATDGLGNHDDENDITVHERDHLLKLTNRERQKKRVMVEKDRMKLAPSRRTGKLTRNPFICIEGGDGNSLCFRIPDGRMAGALPPDYRTSSSICKLIEEKQTKLWHTSYYDSDQKLKQLYIKICKNLPAYNSKVYLVKELRRGNTNKKVACLLGISNEKILLLDSKTKLLLQSREIHELHEWSTGTGRNQDGLLLEFRGSKPWVLAAPSSDKLKSITGALLDVMGKENRLFDNLLFCTSSHDSHNRQLHQYGPQTKTDIYAQELADLQRLLHFPEEVALKLTQTEYRLFNSVPPMYYVRQVTMELSKTPTSLPEDSQQPNIHTLIQRFYEVSSWVTHLIITQPSHEDRKSVLSCILRLLNCCWNYGNFNAAVEILVGLKSEKLKPFWLSIEDEDLSQIDTLSRALLSREPTEEYRQAVRRALSLPGCHVVPFFGSFLRDLQMILVGVPSIVVLPSDEQSPFIKSVSEYKGEDRFLTRIGVGGLINMEKVSQAHLVLTDIHLFHRHSQQMMKHTTAQPKTNQTRHPLITQQDSKDKTCKPLKHPQVNIQANTTDEADSSKHIQLSVDSEVGDNDSLDKEGSGLYMIVPLENTTSTQNNSLDEGLKKENLLQSKESVSKKDSGSDFDASLTSDCDIYEPITPIGNEHGVMLIPPGVVRPNLHDLQVLHHGVTAVHWDSKDAHSVLVYVKLENDNATLSWSKPDWSALRGSSIGLPVDYIFQGEEDRRISTPLISRYITGITLCEDMEEGQLDLLQVKSITSGQTSGDTALIFRRHGLEDAHSSCVTFLVGSSIAENKVIEFVLPKMAAEIWSRCLKRLVRFSRHLRHREIDRRVQWLKDQYLQLYLEGEACLAPTPAEAIRVFGGRKWTTESMSPGSGSDMLNTFKRNTSQASNVSSATKVNKKKLLPLSSFRDTISGTESSDREDLSTSKSSKSTRSSGTSKSSTRSSAMSSRSSTKEVTVIHKNNNKYTLTSIFHPQNLTFAFQRQTSVTSESRRFSLRSQLMESSKPITHSTQLSFGDFVELFKSFYVLLRKDVKELFDEFAVVSPEVDMSDLQKTRPPLVSSTNTGLLTRNQGVEGGIVSADHHKLFNTLSVASIVENRVDSGQQKTLGLKELMEFLVEYQEENPSREEVLALIAKHEHDSALRSTCQMSYEGFCRYLLDEDNFAFIPEIVSQDDHDLDEPLSHYYIESSHNTYLTGHQLKGESSVELYTQVLLTGCRCVELDCWDGDDGFPIIYHGHTLTTKIPFKATLIAINKYAFVASPYPVILSLENHCSVPQQQRMAQMFLDIFGDKLVTEFLFDSDFGEDPDLPSPRNLRYRILVKNKKQRNPQTPASTKQKFAPGRTFTLDSTINDDEEEDEEEEEEDFLADSEVKDESSIQSRPLLSLEKSQSVEQEQSCSLLTQISDLSSMPRDVVASTSSLHTAPRKRSPSTSPTHTRAKSMGQLPLKTASDTTSMTTVPSTPATPLDRRHNSMDNLLDDVGNRKSQGLIQFSSSTDLTEPGTGVFFSGNKAMYKRATRTSSDDTNSHHSHGHSTASPRVSTSSSGKGWFGTLLRSNKPKEVSYSEGEENSGKKKVRHTGSDSPKGSCGREKDRHSLDKDQSRAGSTDEKGKEFDGKLRPRSEPTGLGWQGDDRDVEPTPKPFKKKKVAIAQELSDIIIYTQAVKFKGLITTSSAAAKQKKLTNKKSMIPGSVSAVTGSTPSPTDKPEFYLPSNSTMSNVRKFDDDYAPSCHQMSSLNENKAKQECRKHPTAVICHTERHLMRTYPAGTRIDSSNFNPLFFWAFGIQFAALNYQTDDQATQVNAAMFEQWGRSGYMLKPRVMWDRSHPLFGRFNPHEKEFEGHKPITLKIHLISGQYLCPSHRQGSPYVEVEILGIPADCAKHKSKVSSRNPINPIWNELCTFQIYFPDLAFVRFVVMDTTSGHVTAQRIIPLTCLRPGYRHVRLRNQKNVPLELSTLFIYSRREDEHTSNILSSHDPLHDDMASQSKQGAMLSKIGLTDINKLEKEVLSSVPGIRHKRRLFFISVYGVNREDEYIILNVTQDTTVHETIQQALNKAGKTCEHLEEYILVEVVSHGWDRPGTMRQSILDMGDRVLQAQNRWRGQGKFVLRKTTNDPSTRAWITTMVKEQKLRDGSHGQEYLDSGWDSHQQMFLVCIYNVSDDQPYTILQAPRSSTAQDIITQAMVKARRTENPINFVIVEEISPIDFSEGKQRHPGMKMKSRMMTDDENVYAAQHAWKSNAGRFMLTPRHRALNTEDKNQRPKHPLQRLSFRKLASMRKQKHVEGNGGVQSPELISNALGLRTSLELCPRGPFIDSALNAEGFIRVCDEHKSDQNKAHALPRSHKILPSGKYKGSMC